MDVTELVDALRSPNETDSRAFLRCRTLPDVEVVAEACRGTRVIEAEGEPRRDGCRTGLAVVASPFSITPNSLVDRPGGEGFGDDLTTSLALTLER